MRRSDGCLARASKTSPATREHRAAHFLILPFMETQIPKPSSQDETLFYPKKLRRLISMYARPDSTCIGWPYHPSSLERGLH